MCLCVCDCVHVCLCVCLPVSWSFPLCLMSGCFRWKHPLALFQAQGVSSWSSSLPRQQPQALLSGRAKAACQKNLASLFRENSRVATWSRLALRLSSFCLAFCLSVFFLFLSPSLFPLLFPKRMFEGTLSLPVAPKVRAKNTMTNVDLPPAGLEPAIFGLEVRRLVH